MGESKTIDIWNDIFRSRSNFVKWVGFKLFYDHPWNSIDRKVWNLIEEDKNIVIIHLIRVNKLRSYVLKQIGLKTKIWMDNIKNPNSVSTDQKKIHINSQECISSLEKIEQKETQTRQRYNRHKVIPVTYEELGHDKKRTMRRIFNELGVKNRLIDTSMIKQNSEKLKDLIINYEELYSDLKETKWGKYLNE